MLDYYVSRKARLEEMLGQYEKDLKEFPEGTLVLYNNGAKWYQQTKADDGKFNRKYISRKEFAFASKLAEKAFLEDSIRDIKNEITAINAYLRVRKTCKLEKIISPNSPYLQFLKQKYKWISDEEYETNPAHPEALIVKAPKGQFVRSKSEAIIAHALYEHNLQYKYECAQTIGDYTIYPDFTILHPTTRKTYIWEHFGLADSPSYQNTMCNKIRSYLSCNYVPGHNLILTYETSSSPLDISYIHSLIGFYFEENRI